MAKLIPGRIRNQGITFYEKGLIKIISQKDAILKAEVDKIPIQFSMDDQLISCQCSLFESKSYCEHLAAIEYFLKNDDQGKIIAQDLELSEEKKETKAQRQSFGSIFLKSLEAIESEEDRYNLSCQGQQDPYSNDIWWTLKIQRIPDKRSYIVKDIKYFLKIIQTESYYQIGKNYYERLSLGQFDKNSQQLIEFLWRLIPNDYQKDVYFLFPKDNRYLVIPFGFFEEGLSLLNQLNHFQLEIASKTYDAIRFTYLQEEHALFQFKVVVSQKMIELEVKEAAFNIFFDYEYLFHNGCFYYLNQKQQKIARALKTLPISEDLAKHVHFDLDEQDKLAAALIDFKELGPVFAPKTFEQRDFSVSFDFDIDDDYTLYLQSHFNFSDFEINNKEELLQLPFAVYYKKEKLIFDLIKTQGFGTDLKGFKQLEKGEGVARFFDEILPKFRHLGKTNLSEKLASLRVVEQVNLNVERKGNLLDISFDFTQLAKEDVDQALEALFENQSYFVSNAGQMVVFDNETQKVSEVLKELRATPSIDGHFTMDSLRAFQLSDVFSGMSNMSFSEGFKTLAHDLTHPEQFPLPKIDVEAELRDYQTLGVKWMSMLDKYGFGGILADDMGLGKTLQTIAFLRSKIDENAHVLILAPSSLIYNWQEEFHKFAPSIDTVVVYGSKPTRDTIISERHQVTISSYPSFRQDFEQYREFDFDYLILDEAQVIKNAHTKIAHCLRVFDAKNCFALSGTPIENKLLEIWSIFQIVLPGLLPNQKTFLKLNAHQISRYIKPFVMRRKKEDVLPELPDLIEMTHFNELSDSQKIIYLAQLKQMQERIMISSDSEINRQKIEILSGITRLRQICDTPSLFMDYSESSGKLDSLRELLLQIRDNGHRALIFSQFKGMLDIVERELDKLGLTTYKLTGSTPANHRQEMTRAFNAGSRDAFLISLKAGGVGLNLMGADTVVLIDLWWNPSVEMQAISRAHRIGQMKNVEVYRLITRGTIEEKILEMQENKKNLVTTVLDGDETRASMSIDEIREILGISTKI